MHGNILLAVLTLVAALLLVVPAIVAGWHESGHSGTKNDRDRSHRRWWGSRSG
jgi:hypothetical protein